MSVRPERCFGCHARSIAFTFRGAHLGRQGWHEGTVMGTRKEIYDAARETGQEIERVS
jgi:hypothetical protein